MTVGDLKAEVAAYLHRDTATFTVNSVDLLLSAANRARRWAERRVNFELSRVSAKVNNVDYQNGASLSGAVLSSDGVTAVSIKTVELGFLQFSNGSGTFPIPVITRGAHMQRLRRHFEGQVSVNPKDSIGTLSTEFFSLVRHGDTIYVTPADLDALGSATFTVFMDVIKWLDPYTQDSDNDFLLDYCEDFMVLRTLYQMNFFLKEDERVQISAASMAEMWGTVMEWNASMILNSAEDASLE